MSKMRKGFTLIELMIVIAIIAIIAAIAIPNLMQSRIRANEATAVTQIKNYATAQVTWQVGRLGRKSGNSTNGGPNGYADNYRQLFYGQPLATVTAIALLPQVHADAFIVANGKGTPPSATSKPPAGGDAYKPGTALAPYQGYLFREPEDFTAGNFATDFALIAVPANSETTGTNIYWVGQQGTVHMIGAPAGKSYTTVGSISGYDDINTPTTDTGDWTVL